jgi:hypothetical protein
VEQQSAQVQRYGRAQAPAFAIGLSVTSQSVEITQTTDPLDLVVERPKTLHVTVVDGDGNPLPAVLDVRRTDGDARPDGLPEALFEGFGVPDSPTRAAWVWTTGTADVQLPAGTYTVEAAHSHRHERASVEVVLQDDAEVVLDEVVPRDGWYSIDPHLHAAPSMDGSLAMEERLIACAANGIDVPITTDHDRMADYRPIAAALGFGDRMEVVPGVEVTPIVRGHFNLFPVEPDTTAVNFGALRWWSRYPTTSDLHAAGRATAPAGAILQLNHGRNSLGMFDLAGWTPERVSRPGVFTLDFDLMEIITTKDESDWLRNRNDWMALLSQGEIRVPTGASDSHQRSHPCGSGRTDVQLPAASIAEVDAEMVRVALLGGGVVVAAGVTVRATLDGVGPGGTVAAGSAELAVEVRSPSWIRPDVVRLWKNGAMIEERPIGGADEGLWFSETFEITADEDSWFVIEVDGDTPLGHIWGGSTPYALTNAFFLDVP